MPSAQTGAPAAQGRLSFQALLCACPHSHWVSLLELEKGGCLPAQSVRILSELSCTPSSKQNRQSRFIAGARRPAPGPAPGLLGKAIQQPLCLPSCSSPDILRVWEALDFQVICRRQGLKDA